MQTEVASAHRRRATPLAASVFPPAPSAPVTWAGMVAAAIAIAAGAVLVLLRQTGIGPLDTVWAEDGGIFLERARTSGPLAAVTTSYAGYWHLAPRLLAEAAAAVPLGRAAEAMAIGAAVVQSALAAFIYRVSSGVIPRRLPRLVAAAAMLLLPVGQAEVLASIANVHWFLLPAAVWALLWNPSSRWEVALATVVLVVAALSDPLLALLAPLALLRLVAGRWVASPVPAAGFLVAVGLHLGSVLVVRPVRATEAGAGGPARVASWFAFDVPGRGILGARWMADPDGRLEQVAAIAVLFGITALLVAAARRGADRAVPAVVLGVSALVLFVVPVAVAGTHPPRYSVGPVVLMVSALLAAWPLLPERAHRAAPAVLAALALVWAANLRLDNERARGPRWSDGLEDAAERCEDPASPTESVDVPITPAGWEVRVACDDLR